MIVLARLLDILFWALLLWALGDSLSRWLRMRRKPTPVLHTYVPIHYLGAAAGVTLWALHIGNIDYDKARIGWIQPVAVPITIAGWLLTRAGRNALGSQWTPDVVPIAPESRVGSGPYALMKHPIYIGETIFFFGISIYLANVPTFILLFLGGTLYNFYRASAELSERK